MKDDLNEKNNINSQSQNTQLNEKDLQKQKEHEDATKTAHVALKGASTYYGGSLGNKIYDQVSKTKLGKDIESAAGSVIQNSLGANKISQILNKTDSLDKAEQAIDAASNLKSSNNLANLNNNSLKNSQAKTANAQPFNSSDSINRGHMLVNPPIEDTQKTEKIEEDYTDALEEEMKQEELEQQKEEQERKEKEESKKQKKAIIKSFIQTFPGIFVIGAVVLLLILLFIFIFMSISDYDIVGTQMSKYDQAENISGYCDQIILIKEHDSFTGASVTNIDDINLEETFSLDNQSVKRYSTRVYDLETYVKGVVQAEAIDVKDTKTFEVASIAARTYALQITSKKCYTWDNSNKKVEYKNPQNFTQDNIDEDISNAVSTTSGIVITLNDQLLDMNNSNYYDYFCHIGKDVEKEEHAFYKMLQKNEEERLLLPINWVKENVPLNDYNKSGKYDNSCQKEGMSLFGAKYLLNKKADPYTTIRILKYYYGYHIVLKKVQTIIANGCYYWPTTSTRITSSFGLRNAPVAGASTNHGAIDIGVPEGSDVYATAAGTVKHAGAANGYGYAVYIDHGNGLVSRYGHLKAGGIKVSVGQSVTAGQVIALSGNTGISSGPHLHFEIRLNDVKVDPLNYVSPTNLRPTNCNNINVNGVVNTGDNAKSICLTLKNSGFTNQQIGGIMANLYSESGFNPLAVNKSSGAYGIAQWLGGRKKSLQSLANYTSLEIQLAFLLNELNTSENAALKELLNGGNDANTLTYIFCKKFERPQAGVCSVRRSSQNGVTYTNFATNNCS